MFPDYEDFGRRTGRFTPKAWIRGDAFLVVILERAAERVPHQPAGHAITQRKPDRARIGRGCFESLQWKLQQRAPARADGLCPALRPVDMAQ